MAGIELASAFVTLLPKFDNMKGRIEKEVAGADYDGAGKKGGKALGAGVEQGIKGTSSSIGSTLKGVVGAASGVLAALGFAGLVSEAGQATDSVVKFKQTLGFADLDTSQIDALTASTKAYADKTVYGLTDIQNVTAQLAANSVPNYDKLAEASGNLNAVAGGNADTFKSVGMVLTQTAGAGKLTTENWNQLADAIPGASGKLQEAMLKNGAFTGNFREAMEKGQITAEEFNQAMMDLGMTDAAKEAATSTKTFEGAFGNLQATVVGGISEILGTAQPAITAGANALNDVLAPAFEVVNDVVGIFASEISAGKSPIEALTAAFGELPPQAQAVIGVIAGIGTAFAVSKIASSATSAVKGLSGIASSVASIAGRGVSAGVGLMATAAGQKAAGAAAGASSKQLLASAVAMVALGAGIALACGGFALLAMSAVQLASAGPLAIAVMVGLVAAIALLALGAATLGPALTAGAIGFVAFGGAIALIGLGVALVCAGFALLATQLPVISEHGISAAANIAVLSLSMLMLAPALLLAGVGAVVFGAGVVVAAAGALLFAAAVLLLAAGVAILAVGVLGLSLGFAIMAGSMPVIAASGLMAAAGIMVLSAALLMLAPGLLLAGAGALVFGSGALVAGAGAVVLGAGVVVAAAGVTLLAGGVLLLSGGMVVLAAAVAATAAGINVMARGMPTIASAAPGAAAGLALLAGASVAAAGGLAAGVPAMGALAGASVTTAAAVLVASAAFAAATVTALVLTKTVAAIPAGLRSAAVAFNSLADSASDGMSKAESVVRSGLSRIQSQVSGLRLQLPRIEVGAMPHFYMSGKFDAESGNVPSVGVNWYAKGGVFSGASIIGVGEREPEAVVPLSSRRMEPFAAAIAGNMGGGAHEVTYNINIDNARINDDQGIRDATKGLLLELNRTGRL